MSKNITKKTIKLITGIIIPIFIMVACIVMVGVSYAWFSLTSEISVATINMSSVEAFTLDFHFGDNPLDNYKGELAFTTINNVTHLVTDEYATDETNGLGYDEESAAYIAYMLDAPYDVGANVVLDTEGKNVKFEVYINSVDIYMETTTVVNNESTTTKTTYMSLSSSDPVNLIPYGFTWYILDSSNNKIYSPYGTSINDIKDNDLATTGNVVTEKWSTTPQKQSIEGFSSTSSSTMQIFVVFCPEKLYWLQYSAGKTYNNTADWIAGLSDIYSADERNMIYHLDSYGKIHDDYSPTGTPDISGVTYWDPKYVGAKFEFSFTINVLEVDRT